MRTRRIAVLIDGGFFLKRLPKLVEPQFSPSHPESTDRLWKKRGCFLSEGVVFGTALQTQIRPAPGTRHQGERLAPFTATHAARRSSVALPAMKCGCSIASQNECAQCRRPVPGVTYRQVYLLQELR